MNSMQVASPDSKAVTQQIIDHLAAGGRVKLTLKNRGMRPSWDVVSAGFRDWGSMDNPGEVVFRSRRSKHNSFSLTCTLLVRFDVHFL